MNKRFDRQPRTNALPDRAAGHDPAITGRNEHRVDLQFRDEGKPADRRRSLAWKGFTAEHVVIDGARELAYDWAGNAHYLALHDIKLVDGEIALADGASHRRLDLCDRLTLAPSGCRVTGWSSLANRTNHFTAITYEADVLLEEVERPGWGKTPESMLYFSDPGLRSTLIKLRDALTRDDWGSSAYAETLGLLAVLEINRLQSPTPPSAIPDSGALSARQERMVRDYVAENLHGPLSLSEVAGAAGLTRFHFSRAFSRTFGTSPHAYILRTRIDRAKTLLGQTRLPIASIASQVGFNTQNHFSAVFRSIVRCSPSQFRRAVIDF